MCKLNISDVAAVSADRVVMVRTSCSKLKVRVVMFEVNARHDTRSGERFKGPVQRYLVQRPLELAFNQLH